MTIPSPRTGFPAFAILLLAGLACGGDAAPGEDAAPQDAAASPDTDIWIATLERMEGGLVLGPASNATDRPGYDNQPAFLGNTTVLYTAEAEGDTDIWRLALPMTNRTSSERSNGSPFWRIATPNRPAP